MRKSGDFRGAIIKRARELLNNHNFIFTFFAYTDRMDASSKFMLMILAFLMAAGGLLYIASLDWSEPPREVAYSQGGEFSVANEKMKIVYELEPESRSIAFVAAAVLTAENLSLDHGGMDVELASLRLKDATKFAEKYPGTRKCPAPFFNRHAQTKYLYTASPYIKQELSGWNRKYYDRVHEWETVRIWGKCITGIKQMIENGKDVTEEMIPIKQRYHRCASIYVERITINPAHMIDRIAE